MDLRPMFAAVESLAHLLVIDTLIITRKKGTVPQYLEGLCQSYTKGTFSVTS